MPAQLDLPSISILSSATNRCGGDLQAILQAADFEVSAAGGSIAQLALEEVQRLLAALEAGANRYHFPFAFAEVFHFDGLPAVSAYLLSAEKLRDLGQLLDWIPSLIHPAIRFEGQDDGRWAHTSVHVLDPEGVHTDMPAFVELIVAVVVKLCRSVVPDAGAIHAVQFAHAARAESAAYDAFFACPVSFNATASAVIQESRVLDTTLPGNLPAAHAEAGQTIRLQLIGDGLAPSLLTQVTDLLRQNPEMLGGGIEALAKKLKMNPRTLQRQLKAQGHAYSELLARTRHALALEMLRDGGLDIDSIAYKLGFAERRSFTQAFRKWQGQTPSAYRKH